MKCREYGHDKDEVEHERKVGDEARKTVVDDHEDDDDDEANEGCISALFYGVAPKRWSHGAVFDDVDIGG